MKSGDFIYDMEKKKKKSDNIIVQHRPSLKFAMEKLRVEVM